MNISTIVSVKVTIKNVADVTQAIRNGGFQHWQKDGSVQFLVPDVHHTTKMMAVLQDLLKVSMGFTVTTGELKIV